MGDIRPFITRHEFRQKSNLERKSPFLRSRKHKRGTVAKSVPQEHFSRRKHVWRERPHLCYPRCLTRHWLPKHECHDPRKYDECWAQAPVATMSAGTPASPCTLITPLAGPPTLELQAGESLGKGVWEGVRSENIQQRSLVFTPEWRNWKDRARRIKEQHHEQLKEGSIWRKQNSVWGKANTCPAD